MYLIIIILLFYDDKIQNVIAMSAIYNPNKLLDRKTTIQYFPAIKALLKKLHLPITASRKIIYCHPRFCGLGLPNFYIYSGISKIMMLLGHTQKQDTTAMLINIVLGTVQQQVGISAPLLESNYMKYSHLLEHTWVEFTWRFLHDIRGSIHVRNI